MAATPRTIDHATHENCAKKCFNDTWALLDRSDRTEDDDALMVHTAHCSRYHWHHIGQPKHFARGDWLLARVYAVLGIADRALYYARRCEATCEEHDLSPFDKAYACEAIARALMVSHAAMEAHDYIRKARALAPQIDNEQERQWLLDDLDGLDAPAEQNA